MTNTQRLTISIEVNNNNLPYTFIFPHGCPTQDVVDAFNTIASELNKMIEISTKQSQTNTQAQAAAEMKPQEITPEIVN
jgi:hypothetical protein